MARSNAPSDWTPTAPALPPGIRISPTARHFGAGFLAYLVSLAGAFDTYLDRDKVDASADLLTFRQLAVTATDDEWLTMLTAIREAITPLLERTPPPGARRRLFATIGLPAD